MFDFDNIREIWSTIRKNKLRTFLTGFAVAWGIFILIVLLSAGNGLHNGIMYNFKDYASNQVNIWPGWTSKPYKGIREWRRIRLKNDDLEHIKTDFPEVELCSAVIWRSDTLTYNKEYLTGEVQGVYPDYDRINVVEISSENGRFINEIDNREMRKVIVLSNRMKTVLFHDTNALGQYVRCGNLMYKVVGIYKEKGMNNNPPAYIPFNTAQKLYNRGDGFSEIYFTVNGVVTKEENEAFEKRLRRNIAYRHRFDSEDRNAIYIWNMGNEIRMFSTIMNGMMLFLWIIGISTLIAGIVGVSNIMLVSVRERTREFGIRKALGAKPSSILKLVIIESLFITAIFGYIGMMMGIGLTELINYFMTMSGMNDGASDGHSITMFRDPTVNLSIAFTATIVLIIAGVLAGFFPARKAVKIPAVEAMRAE